MRRDAFLLLKLKCFALNRGRVVLAGRSKFSQFVFGNTDTWPEIGMIEQFGHEIIN